jgi:TM2 domain-containing membrane protein YozV
MSLVPVSKKIPAGICGILLGSLGVHKFIMGFPRAGMTMLGITVACWILGLLHFPLVGLIGGAVWLLGFVEGIIYLAKNDSDFYRDYVIYKKEWF